MGKKAGGNMRQLDLIAALLIITGAVAMGQVVFLLLVRALLR